MEKQESGALDNLMPTLVSEHDGKISSFVVVEHDKANKITREIDDVKEMIERSYNAEVKIAIAYTKPVKKKIEAMYSELSSAKKNYVKLLYIDPKKDPKDEMVNSIKEWFKWAEVPYNKYISAKDIFTSK